jgi:hypothetical protein
MADEKVVVDERDSLFRRLVSFWVNEDGTVNSSAFKNKKKKPDPEPSVDLARLTSPERCREVGGNPALGVGELRAAVPLDLGFNVEHRPVPEDDAHCVILGNHTKETCRRLAEATVVIIPPARRDTGEVIASV